MKIKKDVKKFFRNLNMRKIVKLRTCKSYHFETGLKTVSFLQSKFVTFFTNHVTITLATGNKNSLLTKKNVEEGMVP